MKRRASTQVGYDADTTWYQWDMKAKSQILKDLMDKPVPVPNQMYDSKSNYQEPTLLGGVVTPTPESKMAFMAVVTSPDERLPAQQAKEATWEGLELLGDALGPMDDINIEVNQIDERPRSDSYCDSMQDLGVEKEKEVGLNCSAQQCWIVFC
jgi:hypothetical protein